MSTSRNLDMTAAVRSIAAAAQTAQDAIESMNAAVRQTRRQSENIAAPAFALKYKDVYYNWDKALLKHAVKTDSISTEEQISWWQSNMRKYSYNYYAVMECEEEIYKLNKQLINEYAENARALADKSNDISAAYIEERNHMNDWETFGDNARLAYARVREQNEEFLENGIITGDEYYSTMRSLGENMYQQRIQQSREWLEHEYEYNDMSVDDYIAGLLRMKDYTEEYYSDAIISYSTYLDGMREISENIADMEKEKERMTQAQNAEIYRQWQKSASGYLQLRELYDDWDDFDDSSTSFFERCIERQEEFFAQGIIDWETYNDAVTQYTAELYKAQYSEYKSLLDGILEEQSIYAERVEDTMESETDELEFAHRSEVYDRELGEAAEMIAIYRGAVTQKGKDKYKEYSEKADDIIAEEEIYRSRYEQKETVRELKEQYEAAKNESEEALKEIMKGRADLNGALSDMEETVFGESTDIKELLTNILEALRSQNSATIYGDTNYNISGVASSAFESFVQRAVSGLRG